jgi:hypothetical protein
MKMPSSKCSDSVSNPIIYPNFRALKDDKELAKENSLDSLSRRLKEIGLDPRYAIIMSDPVVKEKRKMGLRTVRENVSHYELGRRANLPKLCILSFDRTFYRVSSA